MEFKLQRTEYQPNEDMIRVATAMPEVAIGDVETNANRIAALFHEAADQHASLVVFPEMALTGYTIQDYVQHPELLTDTQAGLTYLADETSDTNTAAVVGLPLAVGNALYNCAALVADGEIKGIVPKQNLPTYNEFYEKRWFQTWDERENISITIQGRQVPFGRKQLFDVAGSTVGIEICEDVWVPEQPSIELVKQGATIIANPSASPEVVTKTAYRQQLIGNTAARLITGYVYSSADSSEAVSEIVMSGHSMISEAGHMLAEQRPFAPDKKRLMFADVDLGHIQFDRRKSSNFPVAHDITPTSTTITAAQTDVLQTIDASPLTPKGSPEAITERLEAILAIQAEGLKNEMIQSGVKRVVLGLSGGLDSTLALLVAVRSSKLLNKSPKDCIYTLTMPSTASSARTQSNAMRLAESLGIPNEEIPIAEIAALQLEALAHEGEEDITFENTQARLRTQFIFNKGNQIGALALGTGDLSEIALGYCTYNGDHMSGYNPNASIPKTLARPLVAQAATTLDDVSRTIITDILQTPVSAELKGNGEEISQKTEEIIGPYELHDFFLYRHVRWMEPKRKIGFMAVKAFEGKYEPKEIGKWLDLFMNRFYRNQWKRQAMPDGAKVGISLSPKGDHRMAPGAVEPRYSMLDILDPNLKDYAFEDL